MSVLQKFKDSNAWDPRYNLPLVPKANNPWIYLAYATKLVKDANLSDFDRKYELKIWNLLCSCEVKPGLYNRWPDGSGGVTSHDELIGMAYLVPEMAFRILSHLEIHLGYYNNLGTGGYLRFNLYRFVFLKPYLKVRAKMDLNLWDKLAWSAYMLLDALFYKGRDEDGRLMRWLMAEHTQHLWATRFWVESMNRKVRGPKQIFETYLTECPVFREVAPDNFGKP